LNEDFQRVFGRISEINARAPGRVNLIGEHTDYNGGYVLPTALPQETRVQLASRSDRVVRAYSLDLGPASLTEFQLGREKRLQSWADYVQGVTWALAEQGAQLSGFDLLVASTVPIGKGLSSSAALEVAVGRALNIACKLQLSDVDIAMVGHRAETAFVGAPVGIMDQMVCSLGDRSSALFLDAATRHFEKIPLPSTIELGVIDSGIAHSHASGEYRTRRRECEHAATQLGVRLLRDVPPDDLSNVERLPEPLNRRARHVVTENARVLAAVEAIKRADARTLGALFLQSHASMRDDFEVSLPEIDRLVELASGDPDSFGARLTGGGFGGAIVILCRRGTAREVTRRTVATYRVATACNGQVLLPEVN
jgi:galactokinase